MSETIKRIACAGSALAGSLLLASCTSPYFKLDASPGRTPGVILTGPFSGLTGQSTLTAQSVNGFTGNVQLSAACCHDVVGDRAAGPNGLSVWFSQNPIVLSANGSATSTMNMSVGTQAFTGDPTLPFGKYLVAVTAQGTNVTTTQNVGLTLLPPSEPTPTCKSSVPTLEIKPALNALIKGAEQTPRKTSVVIAVYMPGQPKPPDTWRWTIADAPGLAPTEADIVLVNATDERKEVSTAGCSPSNAQTVTVGKGSETSPVTGTTLRLVQGTDRTVVLRKEVCTNYVIICTSWGFVDVAVFSEPLFWRVFGGKTSTFTWLVD